MATTSSVDLSVSGLASGFDWKSLVSQLVQVERAPETSLRNQQMTMGEQNSAYGSVKSELITLKSQVDALKAPSLFDSRTASGSDATVASVSAGSGAPLGSFTFNISQLASNAVQLGGANVGASLSASNDVSGLVLSNAGFSTPVSAGTFTVNGAQITIATSDTLQAVFDKISTATSGVVAGSYDHTSDTITLATGDGSPITLGSATDTSNFLQAAHLYNNGSGTVTSTSALGAVLATAPLASANFATPVSDGGSGQGAFTINGVTINYSATADSLADVITRINNSAAGVTASYDNINDRLTLTNKTTGDIGIALQDVTGNFLAASQLATGTLQRGTNLLYTVNNGGQLTSQDNTISGTDSGVSGLTVNALKTGVTTVQIASDTTTIKNAINSFLTEYNKAQSQMSALTASSTDSNGNVTGGVLANDSTMDSIGEQLRSLANGQVGALTGSIKQLANIGINSNGNDNTLALTDSTALDDALANHLGDLKTLFTDSTSGLAVGLSSYLDATTGDSGVLATHQATLTQESADIDTQVANMETRIQSYQDQLTNEFVAMEKAQSQINQQLTYLTQNFGGSSTSKA